MDEARVEQGVSSVLDMVSRLSRSFYQQSTAANQSAIGLTAVSRRAVAGSHQALGEVLAARHAAGAHLLDDNTGRCRRPGDARLASCLPSHVRIA